MHDERANGFAIISREPAGLGCSVGMKKGTEMKNGLTMTIVAAMALLSGCVCDRCGGNAESREDGFVRIFNGRDLEGWMGWKDLFYGKRSHSRLRR